jgi:aspartyl-tRNA(Asn)/glutamyl-tRNA(Gln) amidotransferase subunit A
MLNNLTIKEAGARLKAKEITSVELTQACLDRIKAVDDRLKSCLTVCADEALKEAEAADKRLADGEWNPLLGIPYLSKDILMTKGIRTTAASKILENYIAPYDATAIARLRAAGAVLLGKTNLDEFAHGASTENSAYGPTHNPWDLERVPGGSSGGSAAAVAADLCLFALGTDTGGSIRQPASFCNIVGLKPSYGRSSRHGLLAMTSSNDVVGPMTKDAADAALVLQVIAGADPLDATTIKTTVPDYGAALTGDIKGLKIGRPLEYYTADLKPEIKELIDAAAAKLVEQGAEMVDVSLPHTKYTVPVYYIITPSEISSNLARFDGIRYGLSVPEAESLMDLYRRNRGRGFGTEVKRRIMLGTYALSSGYYDAYYKKAQKVRALIKREFDEVLTKVDVLLTPTTPHTAFKIGEQVSDPLQMYLEDIFVSGPSLSGLPALTLPAGFASGLPVGMQLIGPRAGEAKLLALGYAYQQMTDWHLRRPVLN